MSVMIPCVKPILIIPVIIPWEHKYRESEHLMVLYEKGNGDHPKWLSVSFVQSVNGFSINQPSLLDQRCERFCDAAHIQQQQA